MNPIKFYIESREREFETKFSDEKIYCCCSREYCYPGSQTDEIINPIKSHIESTTTGLLEVIEAWARDNKENIDHPKDCLRRDYNDALQDLLIFLSESKEK